MKTILLVLVFAFAVSLYGNAKNVTSPLANKTENIVVSKTNHASPTKKVPSKRTHVKKHHKAMGAKSAKAVK